MWSLGLAPGVTCGDSLCPQDTSLTLNTTTSFSSPLGPGPLVKTQTWHCPRWCVNKSGKTAFLQVFAISVEKPLGLRKITGNAAPMTASHKASLLFILLLKTMTSTHTLCLYLPQMVLNIVRNFGLPYSWILTSAHSSQSHLPSCCRWLGGGEGFCAGWGSGCVCSGCGQMRTWCCSRGPCIVQLAEVQVL